MATAQILFSEYLYPLPQSAPLDDSLFLAEMEDDDPIDKNDIRFLIPWSENVSGFGKSDITLTDGFSVVSFRGENSVYEVVIRPPNPISADTDFQGELEIVLAANAVDETNAETTQTFAYSNAIPEAAWQHLFTPPNTYTDIANITRDRIVLLRNNTLDAFTHDGDGHSDEQVVFPDNIAIEKIKVYQANKYLALGRGPGDNNPTIGTSRFYILSPNMDYDWQSGALHYDIIQGNFLRDVARFSIDSISKSLFVSSAILDSTMLGVVVLPCYSKIPMRILHESIQKGETTIDRHVLSEFEFTLNNGDIEFPTYYSNPEIVTDGSGTLYIFPNSLLGFDPYIYAYDLEGTLIQPKRIKVPPISGATNVSGMYIFENHLYCLFGAGNIYRIDLSTFSLPKPLTTIYPLSVDAGDVIDGRKFVRYANDIVFEIGYDKPDWLSISNNRYLEVSADAETGDTALIRLRGINQNGITDENAFSFYIYLEQLRTPRWKALQSLNMFANQELNMFAYCQDADTIEWQHGFTPPTDLILTDGVFTVTGANDPTTYTVSLRAKAREGTFEDITFTLNILPSERTVSFLSTTPYRLRTLIEGIDITWDVLNTSNIKGSLDSLKVNVYVRGEATINLPSRQGYYNSDFPDNFWTTNSLNRNGYLNTIKIYFDAFESNQWVEKTLLFEGLINKWSESITDIQVTLGCVDNTYFLRQTDLGNRRGIGKPIRIPLFPPEDVTAETVVEGIYTPETGIAPLNVGRNALAKHHTRDITLKSLMNRHEGVSIDDTGFLSATDLKTQGGYLAPQTSPILLDSEIALLKKTAHSAVEALATADPDHLYTVDTDIEAFVDAPYVSSNGNLAFYTASGRILRTPIDWIHDATENILYALLSNASDAAEDQLVSYDIAKDQYRVMQTFDASLAVGQLTSRDFNVFFIMTVPALDAGIDRSAETPDPDTDTLGLNYDTAEGANAKILKYTHSDRHVATHVSKNDPYPPQPSIHYWAGFESEKTIWKGIQPTSRASFRIASNGSLYYRFATPETFGVASVSADGETHTEVVAADRDAYQNHLNFAFDMNDDATDLFFAYGQGSSTDSELFIKSDSETFLEEDVLICNLKVLDSIGGAWLGVHEILVHDRFCYMIVPVARGNRDMDKSAGAVLYRYGLDTHQLQVIETYDFVHYGATSLILHNDSIYFLESPDVSYKFLPRNPDLESWDADTGQNLLPEAKGYLKRLVDGGASVESLGNAWFEENAFRGTPMKCLSVNDTLHFVMSEGNSEWIGRRSSRESQPNNFQWLTFGKKLNFRFDLPTSGSVYDAAVDIATKTNATFSLDRNVISVRSRKVQGALANGAITATSTSLVYDNANKTFPESGYLLIDDEILRYTSKTDTAFSNLTRGLRGTEIQPHADNAEILFLRSVVDANMLTGNISIGLHWYQLYNIVGDSGMNVEKTDLESFQDFGQRRLDLPLNLGAHDIVWMEFAADEYLQRYKDVQHLLRFQIQPNSFIELGDIIGFYYVENLLMPLQVMEVTHNINNTQILGRQVSLNITPEPEPVAVDPNESFDTTTGTGDSILVAGNGDVIQYWGDPLNTIAKAPAFAAGASIADQTWTQFQRIPRLELPAVEDEGHGDVQYELVNAPLGISFDADLRVPHGAPQQPQGATTLTLRATDKAGEVAELTFDASVAAASRDSRRTTTGTGDPILVAGNGDVIIYRGN